VIKSRRRGWAGHVVRKGAPKGFDGKIWGKGSTWKSYLRWEGNNKNRCLRSGMGSMDWIDLGQERDGQLPIVKAVLNFWVLKKCG
jgi:hypothetical protein